MSARAFHVCCLKGLRAVPACKAAAARDALPPASTLSRSPRLVPLLCASQHWHLLLVRCPRTIRASALRRKAGVCTATRRATAARTLTL